MRMLMGWALKLSVVGLIYAGTQSGIDIKVPDTIMGFKVPDVVKRSVESTGKIKDIADKTTGGFKNISDSYRTR